MRLLVRRVQPPVRTAARAHRPSHRRPPVCLSDGPLPAPYLEGTEAEDFFPEDQEATKAVGDIIRDFADAVRADATVPEKDTDKRALAVLIHNTLLDAVLPALKSRGVDKSISTRSASTRRPSSSRCASTSATTTGSASS
eukprot:1017792-Prymnesium_polylepis.1